MIPSHIYRRLMSLVILLVLLGAVTTLSVYADGPSEESKDSQAKRAAEEAVQAALTQARKIERGRRLYRRACQTCHGATGNGLGPTGRFLDPLPQDFTKGVFKFRTTVIGALPTDEDLERTIREGVPTTDMPAFGEVFSRTDRMALVAYIKTFSSKFKDPVLPVKPKQVVKLPEKRPQPANPESITRGKILYHKMGCASCHGPRGRGDGPIAVAGLLKDAWGRPIKAHDFTWGLYKSGRHDLDLYRTVTTGLNGTPMAAYDRLLTNEERWDLVDYIKSLSPQRGAIGRLLKEKLE